MAQRDHETGAKGMTIHGCYGGDGEGYQAGTERHVFATKGVPISARMFALCRHPFEI